MSLETRSTPLRTPAKMMPSVKNANSRNRVVRHDQHRDNGVDPAAKAEESVFASRLCKRTVGADRALVGHAAQRSLGHDHRVAERQRQHNIDQQKNTAAVLGRQIREPPDIAQSHRRPGSRQHKAELAGKRASVLLLFHDFKSSPHSSHSRKDKCSTDAESFQLHFFSRNA